MAINNATVLGKTFALPEYTAPQLRTQPTPQQAGGKGPDFGIPDFQKGLQYTGTVGELSRQYAQDWSDLQSYAQNMWKNYNIDVTAPDPSRPEAVEAGQTFRAGLTNILTTADMLKESQDMMKTAYGKYLEGGFMPSEAAGNTPFAMLTPQQTGMPTALQPETKLAADELSQGYRRQEDVKAANARLEQQAQAYEDAAVNDPANAAQYIREAQRIRTNLRAYLDPFAPKEGGAKETYVKPFIERVVSHKYGGGNWQPSTYTDATGSQFLESHDFSNKEVGTKVIDSKTGLEKQSDLVVDKSVRNPVTGETYLVFKNKDVPPQRIDNMSSNQLLEMGLLPKQFLDEAYKYMSEVGATDASGNIVDRNFIPNSVISEDQQRKSQFAESSAAAQAASKEETGNVEQNAQDKMRILGVGIPFTGSSYKKFSPVLNKDVEIIRNKDGSFSIDNISDLYPSLSAKEVAGFKKLTKEQLPAILRAFQLEPTAPTEKVNQGGKKAY